MKPSCTFGESRRAPDTMKGCLLGWVALARLARLFFTALQKLLRPASNRVALLDSLPGSLSNPTAKNHSSPTHLVCTSGSEAIALGLPVVNVSTVLARLSPASERERGASQLHESSLRVTSAHSHDVLSMLLLPKPWCGGSGTEMRIHRPERLRCRFGLAANCPLDPLHSFTQHPITHSSTKRGL